MSMIYHSFPLQIMIASNYSSETGLYEIKDPCAGDRKFIDNYAKIHVRCDMETDGGGWIVIQRRNANGTVNFTRNWEDYVNGFGDLDGDFWIGLGSMHEFTTKQEVELQVTIWNENETITWNYQTFKVGDAENNYRVYVVTPHRNGDIDPLYYSRGHYFSTFDHYGGYSRYQHCANTHQAGWWYYNYRYIYMDTHVNGYSFRNYCNDINLNGRPTLPEISVAKMNCPGNTFTNTEMKIRSTTCGLGG